MIRRRDFLLSSISLALLAAYPKLSYACPTDKDIKLMQAGLKVALGLAVTALIIQSTPILIAAGAITVLSLASYGLKALSCIALH